MLVFTAEPPGEYQWTLVDQGGFQAAQAIAENVLTLTVTSAGCVDVTASTESGETSNAAHACGKTGPE